MSDAAIAELRGFAEHAREKREHEDKIRTLCDVIVKAYKAGHEEGGRNAWLGPCSDEHAARQCVGIVAEALEASGIASEAEILEVVRGRL